MENVGRWGIAKYYEHFLLISQIYLERYKDFRVILRFERKRYQMCYVVSIGLERNEEECHVIVSAANRCYHFPPINVYLLSML